MTFYLKFITQPKSILHFLLLRNGKIIFRYIVTGLSQELLKLARILLDQWKAISKSFHNIQAVVKFPYFFLLPLNFVLFSKFLLLLFPLWVLCENSIFLYELKRIQFFRSTLVPVQVRGKNCTLMDCKL